MYFEYKIKYSRQTGEENPKKQTESYLVDGVNCAAVEKRVFEEIQPYIFGDHEILHCKKANYYDIFPHEGDDYWYRARVELTTIDGEKEIRRIVTVLVQANTVDDAVSALKQAMKSSDMEIITIARSPIVDVFRI